MSEFLLKAQNLNKSYKDRPILRDVSFEVKSGQVVGLLGPNGAGKTTAFYLMTGLLRPDSGQVILNDYTVTGLPIYERSALGIGYLPQESSIFRGMNSFDNIFAIAQLHTRTHQQATERTEQLMEEFSITHLRKTKAISLSGGERRRLEIARALASNPRFLLLDEPFAGVDPLSVRDIRDLVRYLTQKGLGVLVTDHNVRETLDIIDVGYILYEGHILMSGSPEAIIQNDKVRDYYLGKDFYYQKS